LLGQAVLCDFIRGGHFALHIRRMREVYAERLGVLLKGAREKLAGLVEISNIEAGLQTIGWLPDDHKAEDVAAAADKKSVEVIPLRRYAFGRVRGNGIVLGFAAVEPRELRRGVEELATVLRA
jgi:GntR family transcriptional regulator/MocR family aminotransferase